MTLRGKHIFLADCDENMVSEFIYEAKLDHEDGKKDPDIEKTDNISHRK